MSKLGLTDELTVLEGIFTEARYFFTGLYGKTCEFETMNLMRQHVFVSDKSELRYLPQTEDAFCLQIKRCIIQLILYERARERVLTLYSQTDYGRTVMED